MKTRRVNGPLISIGTSGWSYPHWKGAFYPDDLRCDQFLPYYAQRFSTVEINNVFYQLPDTKNLRRWRDSVPDSFCFSVKASRYITHVKRLADSTESLKLLLHRLDLLQPKLGPLLFQLPPRWRFDEERLASFLRTLGSEHRATFEFRNSTWFRDETYDLLAKHRASFCIYDLAGTTSPKVVTTDFVYIRLHGPAGPYRGQYHPSELRRWAIACSKWATQGCRVYCYFDNDDRGYAPQNALCLRSMLNERAGL